MRRPSLLLFAALPLAVSMAVFWACSSGPEARPTSPALLVDGAPSPDATSNPDAPPGRPCFAVDIAAGTGKKFCDLPGADTTDLQVPPEFCVREFTTTPVLEARVLRFAPNGDLFVSAPSMPTFGGASNGPGAIVVLPDDDGDGRADSVLTFAGPSSNAGGTTCAALEADPRSMACVHGLLFDSAYLYFTRSDEIRRFPYAAGVRAAGAATSELVARLGGARISDARWTHTLEQHRDGSLYVSRGRTEANSCNAEEMTRGAVLAVHIEAKAALPLTPEVVADGFRNPMYLRCSPNSCGDCYANELTGDSWDGVGGREKLVLLEKNADSWGYPCCVARDVPAPQSGAPNCGSVGRELASVPLHDTPFGLDFDRGGFPEPYKHGLFMALHGVKTSFGGTGVLFLKADPVTLRPTGAPTMFVKGFGRPNGRATDVVFAPDGRMFVADDTLGKIYWVAPRTLAAPR